MIPIGVTVTRAGTKANYENDQARLNVELNDANFYKASFTGILVHIHDSSTCYVVKDSNKKMVIAMLTEITVTTLAPTLT